MLHWKLLRIKLLLLYKVEKVYLQIFKCGSKGEQIMYTILHFIKQFNWMHFPVLTPFNVKIHTLYTHS